MKEQSQGTIAISGASGFVGSHLTRVLQSDGWNVVPLGRQDLGDVDALVNRLHGVRAVINLAGAPILKRWTEEYKKILVESRIGVTRRLVEAMSRLKKSPTVFISTSAVGYYAAGRRHTEADHLPAEGFLGNLAKAWEHEAWQARDLGVRTCIFRLGVVLGPGGGALAQMAPMFRLGLGGTIGSGSQAFSWIHCDDLIRAYSAAISDSQWEGAYNLTAPHPTTNAALTRALGVTLGRPTWLPVPGLILSLIFGEAATILTQGQEVIPKRLLEGGFQFSFSTIEQAVAHCL
ncbi:MAG: TIGR01777 family oxidoreductase [Proteobacteria bacterium]|nr:TIGR01777 family protein [Desulfobulbaceae bacterium]MBU4151830.1 TIGR01777 family oxidoreductase [Pseudomonadota bacterium]MDP2104849.1 TIGR01777 family oxidoreductase [Desulfobulbaceae bacterium]